MLSGKKYERDTREKHRSIRTPPEASRKAHREKENIVTDVKMNVQFLFGFSVVSYFKRFGRGRVSTSGDTQERSSLKY